jgi:hypothetical protein
LSSPISEKDVVYVIMSMKAKSAPGSNGLTVTFFRKFWRYLKKKISCKWCMVSTKIHWTSRD